VHFGSARCGPALSTPNGTSTGGSVFLISLYNAAGDTALLATDASGAVGSINVNLNGSTTPTTFKNGEAPSVATITVAAVPEPGALLLLSLGLVLVLWRGRSWLPSRD
jgi:PEP-CTERM motif